MNFEWDENKRISNLKKHGLDFVYARYIFDSPFKVAYNIGYFNGEIRYMTLAPYMDDILAVVVHTNRKENIRIISFRRASKKERRYYYANYKNDKPRN
ncbi:MAG: BrnT family toxin [Elusimicrobiota bacterium]|jgi:uncharacterized DUF497 family protein|nr:BrnT family toxin [Elusimicrobiota bacterium]